MLAVIVNLFDLYTGAFENVVVVDQPAEKAAEDDADRIKVMIGCIPLGFNLIQIQPDIIGGHIKIGFSDGIEKMSQMEAVLLERAGRTMRDIL